jgi:hypothetical protein
MEDLALGRRLLANAEAQRQALVSNDHRRVSSVEAEGREIVALQEANSFRRDTAVLSAAQACGMECPEGEPLPKLSELVLHLPLAEAKPLLALRASVLETEDSLRQANERNRVVVQSALEVVHFTFHALADLALRPTGYGSHAAPAAAPIFFLDHQA